jgi:glucose-6-phosphate isomerase
MIKISIYNSTSRSKKTKEGTPAFVSYREDVNLLRKKLSKYQKFQNLVVIGNGGSVNNFKAVYGSLSSFRNTKNVDFLTTVDPLRIKKIRKKYREKNTLIIAISKSGNTVSVIESCLAFGGYKKLFVTGEKGAMHEIAQKENIEVIYHPSVGGRFSGLTSSCFVPAILAGIDVEEMDKGARNFYKKRKSISLKAAIALHELEKKGYTEILCAIYSSSLYNFLPIIVQLMHETVCKNGKGQSIYGDEGPEIQHHTSQRFFGGRKNAVGFFIALKEKSELRVKVSGKLSDVEIRSSKISDIGNIPYHKALEFEFLGTMKAAVKGKKPVIVLEIDKINPQTVGELMAFFQYMAVYSALLRKVNPYNQPAVEESKKISFELRKRYK